MLWMCIWMCPHHVTAAHADQACRILLQIWASLSWYVMVKWGELGCWPNPYSSHINVIYIKGVWHPLYAVDEHMDVSPPSYGRSCRPSFWNFLSRCPSSSKHIKRIYRYINLYYSTSSVTFSAFSVSIWYLIRFWKNNIISNNILMLLNIFNIYFDLYNLLANILLFFSWHCIVSRCTLLYSYRILFGEN